tara:strand:- start:401 stop:2041 length:1641 start_codon:yes stop_codon:yes gene_type:complete
MSIISGLTPAISYLTKDEEGNPKTAEDYNENFKDYIFDYTDPVDIATLPLYALGPAGIAANRAIKAGRVANKAFKPSGIQSFLSKPGVNVGIPSATLAGDVTYDLATDEEFMGDIKTIAGIEDDALDQANEDLKKVNEKEEQEVADAEDMDDASEEEKGIGALQDQLAVFQGMMDPGEMTGGYTIASSGVDTPEIRRYAGGGIANLDPVMMASGGVPGFNKGIAVLIKETAKKVKDAVKSKKKDKVEAEKKKSDTKKEETDITKDKKTKTQRVKEEAVRAVPPEIATAIGVPIGASLKLSKEALKKAGGEGGIGRGAARTGIYGGLGLAAYNALTDDDDTSSTAAKVKLPPPPELEESDALKDILYQNSLERATAAGRTEPSFMDYLASFPGSYTEKVGKDPEFAKQMMAGFMAMMKPTEGFVPRNALVDFGEAAYAEQARQQDAVPDQLQLIKEFAENPELAKAYRDFQRSAEPVDLVTEQQNRELLFRNLQTMIFGEKFDEDDDIPVDIRTGQPADPFNVYNEFIALGGDTAALTKIKENYAQP